MWLYLFLRKEGREASEKLHEERSEFRRTCDVYLQQECGALVVERVRRSDIQTGRPTDIRTVYSS